MTNQGFSKFSKEEIRTAYIKTFRKVLERFNEEKVGYCVLRNYEFIFDGSAPLETHLDMVISKESMSKAKKILANLGGISYPSQFSQVHQGSCIYLEKEMVKVGFDIQNGGVHWNDIIYLTANQVIANRIKVHNLYTLGAEDSFIMYLCHSILGKRRFKKKYSQILTDLVKKELDWKYIKDNLRRIFNRKIALFLLRKVHNQQFRILERLSYLLAFYFVTKRIKNWWPFVKLSFRWFFTPKHCPLRLIPLLRYLVPSWPLIAIIGPDGSGKSTMSRALIELLNKKYKAELVYMGRGNANLIPLRRLGDIYKKKEIKKDKMIQQQEGTPTRVFFLRKVLYTLMAPFYTLDLWLRYLFIILPKRKKEKIVVTDRYCSDILLMEYVPLFFRKILLLIFPKPTLTFYLHNDPKVLYERRRSQSIEELERQMKLFSYLARDYGAIDITSNSKQDNFEKIAQVTYKMIIEGS